MVGVVMLGIPVGGVTQLLPHVCRDRLQPLSPSAATGWMVLVSSYITGRMQPCSCLRNVVNLKRKNRENETLLCSSWWCGWKLGLLLQVLPVEVNEAVMRLKNKNKTIRWNHGSNFRVSGRSLRRKNALVDQDLYFWWQKNLVEIIRTAVHV